MVHFVNLHYNFMLQDLFELERSFESDVGNIKTQLDVYLDGARLHRKAFRDLDVLSYWKENQHRFGDLWRVTY